MMRSHGDMQLLYWIKKAIKKDAVGWLVGWLVSQPTLKDESCQDMHVIISTNQPTTV